MFIDWKTILLRCQYYPKQSTDSMQALSKSKQIFCRNRNIHPKIHMESTGIPNNKTILKKKKKNTYAQDKF